jgi:hypothetical protein
MTRQMNQAFESIFVVICPPGGGCHLWSFASRHSVVIGFAVIRFAVIWPDY